MSQNDAQLKVFAISETFDEPILMLYNSTVAYTMQNGRPAILHVVQRGHENNCGTAQSACKQSF